MYGISFLSFDAARGEIATTLAHIYLEHKSDFNKEEENDVAEHWEFKEEIETHRNYESGRRLIDH